MGQTEDGMWLVSEGLKPGDCLVTTGFQKIIPGNPVKIVKTTIENDIKGKGYVNNLPVFYVPELTKYIDKVNNYITSINKLKNIGKITDCNMWLQLL